MHEIIIRKQFTAQSQLRYKKSIYLYKDYNINNLIFSINLLLVKYQ